ncbi:2126_t:CDS:2, partial [Racocetra persica]
QKKCLEIHAEYYQGISNLLKDTDVSLFLAAPSPGIDPLQIINETGMVISGMLAPGMSGYSVGNQNYSNKRLKRHIGDDVEISGEEAYNSENQRHKHRRAPRQLWTDDEVERLKAAYDKHNGDWELIIKEFEPERTSSNCPTWFTKQYKKGIIDESARQMGLRAVESGKLIDLTKSNTIIEYHNSQMLGSENIDDEGAEYEQENADHDPWQEEGNDVAPNLFDSTNQLSDNASLDKSMHATNSLPTDQMRRNDGKLRNLYTIPFFLRSGRRYLPFFTLFGIMFIITSVTIVNIFMSDELIIESRTFEPQPYIGLHPNVKPILPKGSSIYHVSKEFGTATMGGLGHVVTALAEGQSMNSRLNINVIIPSYSFLQTLYKCEFYAHLSIKIQNSYGEWKPVNFGVLRFLWNVNENPDILSDNPPQLRRIWVYIIEPSTNYPPFDLAFRASSALEIYSAPQGLPQEWMNLYFCKAVAELITYLDKHAETPLFARLDNRGVDVVHLHGATNALVIDFLRELYDEDQYSKPSPPIVYTMHDYLEEQLYSTLLANFKMFRNSSNDINSIDEYLNYIHGRRFYPSALAIDRAQIITFVSETMAKEMVEGSLDFRAKELIMPSILHRASK